MGTLDNLDLDVLDKELDETQDNPELVALIEELNKTKDLLPVAQRAVRGLSSFEDIEVFVRGFIKKTIAEEIGENTDDSKRIAFNNLSFVCDKSSVNRKFWQNILEEEKSRNSGLNQSKDILVKI